LNAQSKAAKPRAHAAEIVDRPISVQAGHATAALSDVPRARIRKAAPAPADDDKVELAEPEQEKPPVEKPEDPVHWTRTTARSQRTRTRT
jgi:hypothetical protein